MSLLVEIAHADGCMNGGKDSWRYWKIGALTRRDEIVENDAAPDTEGWVEYDG